MKKIEDKLHQINNIRLLSVKKIVTELKKIEEQKKDK